MIMSESCWAPEPGSGLSGPGWFSQMTFPQRDRANAAPAATPANVPLLSPAAQRWQLECGGTGAASPC